MGEVEELLDTRVTAAQQLRVHVGVDHLLADRRVAPAPEEVDLEGETEQAGQPERRGVLLEAVDDRTSDAVVQPVVAHQEGAHLAEVFPEHVQGAASDQHPVGLRDDELLHGAVQHRQVFAEQDALLHERLQQVTDADDVGAARRPDDVLAHITSLEPVALRHLCRTQERGGCRSIRPFS
ncbi:hypothetical protein D514_0104295 [Microbacterium sp. UCD-TDU]|nr:hypothetical protein D514_0104295 [Microbacterium sp. UCD-TDU]